MKKCSQCDNFVQDNWKCCPFCGSMVIINVCVECGAELQPNWKVCPICRQTTNNEERSPLPKKAILQVEDFSELISLSDNLLNEKRANDNRIAQLKKARACCITGKFDKAQEIYESMIVQNVEDIEAYIGMVRIESQNYTVHIGEKINSNIRYVEGFSKGVDLNEIDAEYVEYLRKHQIALIEIQKVEEQRKMEEAKHNRDFKIEDGILLKYNGSIDNVVIPNEVISIGKRAFEDHENLKSVVLPQNITSIQDDAFRNCKQLKCINIPNSVRNIGIAAFSNCKQLKNIIIPDGVTDIKYRAFENCINLTSVVIPNSVTNIHSKAFYNCKHLKNITIPTGVICIGNAAFSHCLGLTEVSIPNSVTKIDYDAFNGCKNIINADIPDSVEQISQGAFVGTGLKNIEIPRSCESWRWLAFSRDCKVTYR